MEVTDTSAKAVGMVKQQQSEQICWGSSNPVMSLGMWSLLAVAVAVAARSAVGGRAVPVHLAGHRPHAWAPVLNQHLQSIVGPAPYFFL